MKNALAIILLMLNGAVIAQNYPVGHTTITFNDPARTGGFGSGGGTGRQIQTEIYYPATSAGDDTPFAATTAPVIVFGHGFVMSWDAYMNLVDHFVPLGYILAFPRTEGSFTPDHLDFGKDLVIVGNRMEQENTNSSSIFYNKYNGKKGVMGHSMGGGATFLAAAESNASFDLAVGLAPAETNPSAVTAAANNTLPGIILSGSGDAVTPPANHHDLIYNSWASACKTFVSITGGAHCYFANSNLNCDFGEATSGGNITIDRTTQHDITFDILDPYLAFHLKGTCSSWNDFLNVLQTDNRFVENNACAYQLPNTPIISQNGTQLNSSLNGDLQWFLNGNLLNGETNQSINWTQYGAGNFTVELSDSVPCSATSAPFTPTLSISEESISFSVQPNPFHEELSIFSEKQIPVGIYNSVGQLLMEVTVQGETKISTAFLKPGMYFLKSNSGHILTLIKQ
ncbi:MAG: T9SS type A sorting domain-containing protein [Fluviicola sp.]|jgi:dienelactone hydrolase